MQFSTPLALLLLVFIPIIIFVGWPRKLAGQSSLGFGRESLALLWRVSIALLLILALGGIEIRREANQLAVAFLVDISDSVPRAAWENALKVIEAELREIGPDDLASLVVFGGDALVEQGMSKTFPFNELHSQPQTSETNVAGALRLAQALFPPDYARRIVLFSDGRETVGKARIAAEQAILTGIDLVIEPYTSDLVDDVWLTGVKVPARLIVGDRFDLELGIDASINTTAEVTVFADGEVTASQIIQVSRGEKIYRFPLEANASGFIRYAVQITPQVDGHVQNNGLSAFSLVDGPPTVLLIAPPPGDMHPLLSEPRPDEGAALAEVMEIQGYQVVRRPPSFLPNDLVDLGNFDAVILVDVPADQVTSRQLQTVESYVRDLGGGLLVVGGPTSFGVGGYYQTPLETTLPVEMRLQDDARKASVSIAFVIDQSGSMAETSGGANKLELAKEATIRSIQLMFPDDRVGVVSFDDVARWVAPFTTLSDPQLITQEVGRIRSAGGTDILAGLQAVAAELPNEDSLVRHIVLLTDGGADPAGIPELVAQLKRDHNITLTTIGIGQNAAPYLSNLAEIGGGRYHFAASPGSIPSIFTLETSLVTRAYIVEEDFFPRAGDPSPILSGIAETPLLRGYVATSAKPTARVVLTALDGDPLLATWQYGLGSSAAFTSDATGRWAQDWVTWDKFPKFWGQVIASIARTPSPSLLNSQITQSGNATTLTINAADLRGTLLNQYRVSAIITKPDLETINLDIPQVAPGQYEATFSPFLPGAYLIQIIGIPDREGNPNLEDTFGWVRPYPSEYVVQDRAPPPLETLILETGAREKPSPPWNAFTHDIPGSTTIVPVWPWLLSIALLMLPIDVAIRRLAVPTIQWREALDKLLSRAQLPATSVHKDPERTSQIEALGTAKARAMEMHAPNREEVHPPPSTTPERGGSAHQPFESIQPAGVDPEESETLIKPDELDEIGDEAAALARALLARKHDKDKNG